MRVTSLQNHACFQPAKRHMRVSQNLEFLLSKDTDPPQLPFQACLVLNVQKSTPDFETQPILKIGGRLSAWTVRLMP